MSRMQDALFRKDYDCAKPAVPLTEISKADAQERSDTGAQSDTLVESDYCRPERRPILWIVPKSRSRGDRSTVKRTARLKSIRLGGTSAPGTRTRSESTGISVSGNEKVSGQPRQKEKESLAAEIQRFQERADLRECLLPGMLSPISRKACEGWRRQVAAHNSRMMARIKLEPCKECQYCMESATADN